MNVSRRGFFRNLGERAIESLGERLNSPEPPRADKSDWIEVGSISDFPPGTRSLLAKQRISIASHEEGIQAVEGGALRPMRLERNGMLSVQLRETWPEGSAISVMTGERIQLSSACETEGSHHE